jgi:transcriptional regulator GlxA family with amidase domain
VQDRRRSASQCRHRLLTPGTTDLTVDVVAARAGLGSPDTLRHHFTDRRGITPTDHRRAFRTVR